ncbi:MAG: hypothetical protein ACRD4Q_10055 [Candidatus Acidiferrales bacterium]
MRLGTESAAALLLIASHCSAMRPSAAAERAYANYVVHVAMRLDRQHASPGSYLAIFNLAPPERTEAERHLLSGALRVEPVHGGTWTVDGALMHHWRGEAFVPGATAKEMLAVLRDYKHFRRYYAPEVVSARVLAEHGRFATVEIRFKKQMAIIIVLDAECRVETAVTASTRGYSISRSTHIWQIDQPGTAHERRLTEEQEDGFLWHLNSYWSFIQWRNGLLMECEAVSLTRSVPRGLGWLIEPIIEDLPRTSLEFTLRATENALEGARKGARQ